MKNVILAAMLVMSMNAAMAQESPTGVKPSDVSGPPIIVEPSTNEPVGYPQDDVSGPPAPVLTKADKRSDGSGILMAGAGLVGLIGLGKVAQRRKAKKQDGIGDA